MRVVLATAVALVALAPAAQAKIVVQESIAGVKVGMSAKQVREVLGAPRSVSYPKDEIQGSFKHYDYGLTDVFITRGTSGVVFNITTRSRAQRTASGIGVGSTRKALQRAFPKAKCQNRYCSIGEARPGKTVTSFFLSATFRVRQVALGIVID
ncbi:MAG TPA: hypothetical protein VFZ89_14085 [Solirubrobacteraceae bacterium]